MCLCVFYGTRGRPNGLVGFAYGIAIGGIARGLVFNAGAKYFNFQYADTATIF